MRLNGNIFTKLLLDFPVQYFVETRCMVLINYMYARSLLHVGRILSTRN